MSAHHQPYNVDCRVFSIALATDSVFNIKAEIATYENFVMQTHMKEYLTQSKFEPFPKIKKRSNRCKSYITYLDVFGICRWIFDNSDPVKDKRLFMACYSVFEEWSRNKYVKIKMDVFLDEKVHRGGKCHLCCID